MVLALVIFNFESSLPTRRIEFYQKCIDTFLTERENRKAAVKLSDKTKSILAMNLTVPKIAFYMHNKLMHNSAFRFDYSELETAIKEAIAVEDEINWATAVKQYSEYLVERTELIQEIDENYLDFAHKTFYEYFLAFYFCKMCDNEKLVKLLCDWIGDPNYDELARLIIEVVIQNNEPKQHDNIIDCLFEMLLEKNKSQQEWPDKRDVFAVISDLYTHNLLQPKYQYNYHKFVLYNPQIIDYMNFMHRRREIKNNVALYDPQIVGNLFLADYQNEKLIDVIDAIYYLNNEFKKIVIPSDASSLLYNINELFVALGEKKKGTKNGTNIVNYFIGDGIEYTLKYPQIFMALISLSIKIDIALPIEQLLRYNFSPRNVFYNYTTSDILFSLIDAAMKSKKSFALFLISSIDCAYEVSNSIYIYVINNVSRFKNADENLVQFCVNLWHILNKSNSMESFKNHIKDLHLYDEVYDYLYEKLYYHYLSTEKGCCDEHIKSFIKKQEKKQRT